MRSSGTIIILAKNKQHYERWVRDVGQRLSGVTYMYAGSEGVGRGMSLEDTYYIQLESAPLHRDHDKILDTVSSFKEIQQKDFENAVKKGKPPVFIE